MYVKIHIKLLLIFFLFSISFTHAQTVRSTTNLETSSDFYRPIYLANSQLEQTIFWRKRYNKQGQEKDSYFFHSIYFKDSLVGVKLLGFEFNLMHERFEKSRFLNKFRQWNIIRIGGAIGAEHIFWNDYHSEEDLFEYFNGNIYLSYYHIPKKTRGDRTTKNTRGSWGFLVDVEFNGRYFLDFYIKAFPYTKMHIRHKSDRIKRKYYALLFEFELNEHAYNINRVESTKDIYSGVSLLLGFEYNPIVKLTLNLGIKMDYRNH